MPHTSSPKSSPKSKPKSESVKPKQQKTSRKSQIPNNAGTGGQGGAQHPSPMSRVTRLDSSGWVKAASGNYPDNQHARRNDCGCHSCIRELAVVKFQPIDRKRNFSTWFKDRVGNLRIYSPTDPKSHPEACLCKTHLEREWALAHSKSNKAQIPQSTAQK